MERIPVVRDPDDRDHLGVKAPRHPKFHFPPSMYKMMKLKEPPRLRYDH